MESRCSDGLGIKNYLNIVCNNRRYTRRLSELVLIEK